KRKCASVTGTSQTLTIHDCFLYDAVCAEPPGRFYLRRDLVMANSSKSRGNLAVDTTVLPKNLICM
ncbi:MAG: hypothetical protein J2P56_04210, partial [Verrucomicrobia bacterium]|nr:hypothetical protein [Verrucomicrobiota bacterium]